VCKTPGAQTTSSRRLSGRASHKVSSSCGLCGTIALSQMSTVLVTGQGIIMAGHMAGCVSSIMPGYMVPSLGDLHAAARCWCDHVRVTAVRGRSSALQCGVTAVRGRSSALQRGGSVLIMCESLRFVAAAVHCSVVAVC
jgi:hypothetical protein